MLYRRIENSMEEVYAQLLVPSTMKNDVLKSVHDLIHGGGHMGVKRTFARLKERFFLAILPQRCRNILQRVLLVRFKKSTKANCSCPISSIRGEYTYAES
ncbi:unnamed protein product [Clavelina lepadiformis]|uniref:Integrase zinc-binding domain-containing protein n=1 Tax=Clavelina lepadiformis TaxID=159417 RepID=A0ABP0FIL4_CLALP